MGFADHGRMMTIYEKDRIHRLCGMLPSGEWREARIPLSEPGPEDIPTGRKPEYCRMMIPESSLSRRRAGLKRTREGITLSDELSRRGCLRERATSTSTSND